MEKVQSDKIAIMARKGLLIAIICMFICQFLPYATATKDLANRLKDFKEVIAYEEVGYTCGDLINISMAEFTKINNTYRDDGILYIILMGCIGGFAMLSGLVAYKKKYVKTIVFVLLSSAAFWLQSWDYESRHVVPSDDYKWGIGYYMFILAAVIALVSAIYLKMFMIRLLKKQAGMNNIEKTDVINELSSVEGWICSECKSINSVNDEKCACGNMNVK